MKWRLWALAAGGWLLLVTQGAAANCSPNLAPLRGEFGHHIFRVELAETPAERSRGLMFRTALAPDSGMLFLYPRPHRASFWMKNTYIALDILFFDASGTLTRLHPNAVPEDLTNIDGGPDVTAVLEIPGGRAEELGITLGAELRHPHFDVETAAWPCR